MYNQKSEIYECIRCGNRIEIERKNANGEIDAAEEIEDTSVILNINQIRYFNYMVGDIDKAQAENGVM